METVDVSLVEPLDIENKLHDVNSKAKVVHLYATEIITHATCTKNYNNPEYLGRGKFGVTYKVDNPLVVIKIQLATKDLPYELNAMKVFHSLGISVELKNHCRVNLVKNDTILAEVGIIIMERLDGTLSECVVSNKLLSPRQVKNIGQELIRILTTMIKHKVSHNDCYSANIGYLCRNGIYTLKLIDFGFADIQANEQLLYYDLFTFWSNFLTYVAEDSIHYTYLVNAQKIVKYLEQDKSFNDMFKSFFPLLTFRDPLINQDNYYKIYGRDLLKYDTGSKIHENRQRQIVEGGWKTSLHKTKQTDKTDTTSALLSLGYITSLCISIIAIRFRET
jgi:serine/threonine protein kinase